MNNERILILDFGGHFNQLVARRVRECLVYCEVYGSNMTIDEVKKYNPKGIILVGADKEFGETCNKEIFNLNIPILGICYGTKIIKNLAKNNSNVYMIDSNPNILETQDGFKELSNFVLNICGCSGDWKISDFVNMTISSIRERVGS